MAGITPDEGENAVARVIYDGDPRTSHLTIGIWEGTSAPDEATTYATTGAVFDKLGTPGLGLSGFNEKTLTDGSWTVTGDTATYTDQVFTAGAGVTSEAANGYFIAMDINTGTKTLLHLERDGTARSLSTGETYTIGISNTVA